MTKSTQPIPTHIQLVINNNKKCNNRSRFEVQSVWPKADITRGFKPQLGKILKV